MSTVGSRTGKELYEFGPFRVEPEKQTLLRGGEPIALTPKTFQLLLVLLRHSNQTVTKDELMKAIWPDTFVEESNLSQTPALRKALGKSAKPLTSLLCLAGVSSCRERVWPGARNRYRCREPPKVKESRGKQAGDGWRQAPWLCNRRRNLASPSTAPQPLGKETQLCSLIFQNLLVTPMFDGTLRRGLKYN
jgi:hypothetical protein